MLHSFDNAYDTSGAVRLIPNDGPDSAHLTIPDAHLLFTAEFKRTGSDLVLTGSDGKRTVVADYFKNDKLPTLLSPDGAALAGDIIAALAGSQAPGQYAQATAPTPTAPPVGRVESVTGNVVAVRNGVAVVLNVGDAVYKSDVIQTGANSAVGIAFVDASAFNLNANGRIMLSELIYDPNASSNTTLLNLVQGAATFISGQVSKSGEMFVQTPSATVGIRGTIFTMSMVAVDGTFDLSVLEYDGQPHEVTVRAGSSTGPVIGVASNRGGVWRVQPAGVGQAVAQESPKTPQMIQEEVANVTVAINLQVAGQAIYQGPPMQLPAPPQAPTDPQQQPAPPGPTPQSTPGGSGGTPPPPVIPPAPPPLQQNNLPPPTLLALPTTPVVGPNPVTPPPTSQQEPPPPPPPPGDKTIFINLANVGNTPAIAIGGAGKDIVDVTGTDGSNSVVLETVEIYQNRTGTIYTGPAEILLTSPAGTILVEISQVEEIVFHGTDGDDTLVIAGNFNGTALLQSTIFIYAGGGNDLVVLERGSDHRVVVDGGPGEETAVLDFAFTSITAIQLDPGTGVLKISHDGITDEFTSVEAFKFPDIGPSLTLAQLITDDTPVANADTLSATEDTPAIFAAADLLGNDNDGDPELSQPLSIASVTSGTGGAAVLNAAGTVTFTPNAGFSGQASFSYTISDGITTSTPATVTVNVGGLLSITASTPAHLVEASSQGSGSSSAAAALTLSGVNVTYDAAALFLDGWINGGNGTFTKAGLFGTAALNINNNTLGYLLDNSKADKLGDNDTPTESFTVPVTDGTNDASTIVGFTIEGRNDAPRLGTTPELSFETGLSAWQVLGSASQVAGGTDGAFAAQLITGFNSQAELEAFLDITPGILALINTAPSGNNNPTAGSAIATEISLQAGQVLSFDWLFETDDYNPYRDFAFFTVSADTAVKLSDVFVVGDFGNSGWQTSTFVAPVTGLYHIGFGVMNAGDNGVDSLLEIDNVGGGANQTLNVVEDASASASETTTRTIHFSDPELTDTHTLSNPIFVSSDYAGGQLGSLSVALAADTVNGIGGEIAAEYTVDNSVIQFLSGGQEIHEQYQFTISDGQGGTTIQIITVVIAGTSEGAVNDPPVANPDTLATTEDTPAVYSAADLLGNDDDGDPDLIQTLSIASVTSGTGGTAALNPDGTVTFTPAENFNGPASFSYTISDGETASTPATVTVNVAAVNDAPVANDDVLSSVAEDSGTRLISLATLTGNDSKGPANEAGQALTITAFSNVVGGTATINGNNIEFTPAADFNGTASFDYTVQDNGQTDGADDFKADTGSVSFAVTALNDAPVLASAIPDQVSAEDALWTYVVPAGTFSDIDGDTLAYSATLGNGAALPAWLSFDADTRTFSGTPPDDFDGELDLKVTASDGELAASDTFALDITPVNDAPALDGDLSAAVSEGGVYPITTGDLFFVDPDDAATGVTFTVSNEINGTVLVNGLAATSFSGQDIADGLVSFAHDGTQTMSASFDVVVEDGDEDGSAPAAQTFHLTVTGDNDAPVLAQAIADQSSPEDTAWLFAVPAGTFSDVDNATLAYSATLGNGAALPAWLSFDADTRTFSGTPPADFDGELDLKVTASDGEFAASDTFTLDITPVNDAPVINNATGGTETINEGQTLIFEGTTDNIFVSDADADAGGDTLTMLLSVQNGRLDPVSASAFAGLTPVDADGGDGSDGDLAFTGTLAAINQAIAGGVLYTPATDYFGSDTFTLVVSDNGHNGTGGALEDSVSVAIEINAVNDAPVVDLQGNVTGVQTATTTAAFSEGGGAVTIAPELTLSDIDNTTLAGASVTLSDPQAGDVLSLQGQAGTSGTLASGIEFSIVGATVTFSNAASLSDYQAALRLVQFDNPGGDPDTSNRHFSFEVNDGGAANSLGSATATVTVGNSNNAPDTNAGAGAGNEDTLIAVALSGSDVDGTVASFRITGLPADGTLYSDAAGTVAIALNGTVAASGNAATVYFRPTADFNGGTSFQYAAIDNLGAEDATPATANVTVNAVNDAPAAVDDVLSGVAEDSGTRLISFASLTGNDSKGPANEAGQALTIAALSNVVGGAATINGSNVEFTPDADFNGTASFDYTVQDNGQSNGADDFKTDTGSVSFAVTAVNDAPVANDDVLSSVAEDSGTRLISFASLTGNDSKGPANEAGQALTIAALSNVVGGTATINGSNIEFTPDADFNGTASFDYTVQDNGQSNGADDFKTDTGSVSFAVTAVNDAPVAVDDVLSGVAEDSGTRLISFASLTGNDSDGDPELVQTLTIAALSNVVGGTATINGNNVEFTPDADFNGTASFEYTVQDNGQSNGADDFKTDTGSVSFAVTAANDAPVANDDVLSGVAEDSGTRLISFASLLGNDSDGDPELVQTLTITAVSNVVGGTATINGSNIEFTADVDFNGTASFDYTVQDNGQTDGADDFKTDTGSVSFAVTAANDAPVANDDVLSGVAEDSGTRLISFASLTGNDSKGPANEAGQTLTITAVSNVVGGTATINGSNVEFTPDADFNGTASFDYTVQDNGQSNGADDFKTDTGSVSFAVTAVNDAPVAVDDVLSGVAEDSGTRIISFASLTGNDSKGPANEAGHALTITAFSNVVGGTAAINGSNIEFTPASDFNGTASFDYTVQDNGQSNGADDFKTDTGSVSFAVTAANDAPVVAPIVSPAAVPETPNAVNQDIAPIHGSLSVSDADVGNTLTASIVGPPTVMLNGQPFTLPTGAVISGVVQSYVKNIATGEVSLVAGTATGTLVANAAAALAIFSPDGSKLAFSSSASNLVPNDTNGSWDTFVKDLSTGAITRVSTTAALQQLGGQALPQFGLAWSADGTKIVYGSTQTNLVAGDTNGEGDLFVRDLVTNAVQRITITGGGTEAVTDQAPGHLTGQYPSFSPDGTKVMFRSDAANLVAGDNNDASDIFIKDLVSGVITRVSTDSTGAEGAVGQGSFNAVFSPDGTKIVFSSNAQLAPGANSGVDLFLKDLTTGVTTRIATGTAVSDIGPVFSPDGTQVLFYTLADVFIKNLNTGTVTRVSETAGHVAGNGQSAFASFSPDGTKVLFYSLATNLVAGDTNAIAGQQFSGADWFVKDLVTGDVIRVSTDAIGTEGHPTAEHGAIFPGFTNPHWSPDGQFVVFDANFDNLLRGSSALNALDALTFGNTATSDGGSQTIDWTYDPAAANLDFLREGQTLTITYTVKVNDGLIDSNLRPLTVTIVGVNDAPALSPTALPAALAEAVDASAQDLAQHGALLVTDDDVGDTLTATVVGSVDVKLNGSPFVLPASAAALIAAGAFGFGAAVTSDGGLKAVQWSYDPGPANLDFLAPDQTLTLTYAVKVGDGIADSATQLVTITIAGTNDAPALSVPGNSVITDENTPFEFTGAHVADPDAGDVVTLNLSVANGTLEAIGALPPGVTVDDGDGSDGTLQVHGSAAAIDALLTSGVKYTPDAGLSGIDADTLTISVKDGANATDTENIAITINPALAAAPVVTVESAANHVLVSSGGFVAGRAVDQTIYLPNLGLSSDSAVTVEFWLNPTAGASQMPFGFFLYDLLLGDAGGNLFIGFNTGQGDVFGVARSDLAGSWHHIAAVFVDGNVQGSKLYIDGVEQPVAQLLSGPFNPNADIQAAARIGGWDWDSQYSLDGGLDELRIWHGERTAAEIVAGMDGTITGAQPDLMAAYSFESVANGPNGVTDSSGNARHGTFSTYTTANVIADATLTLDQSISENQPLVFSDANDNRITVSDADDASLSVTLAVAHGTVTLASLAGLSVTAGANGTSSITVSGLTAALNTALDGLSYQPDAGYEGTDALTVTAFDGVLSGSNTIGITINPAVNGAPSIATVGDPADLVDAGTSAVGDPVDGVTLSSVALVRSDPDGDAVVYDPLTLSLEGWTSFNMAGVFDTHYYLYVDGDFTWAEAREFAELIGGYLANITSAQENDLVSTVVGAHSVFLGGSDAASEGTWRWADGPEAGSIFWDNGLPVFYENWAAGEPNNFGPENALEMRPDGAWNDVAADAILDGFVVEFDDTSAGGLALLRRSNVNGFGDFYLKYDDSGLSDVLIYHLDKNLAEALPAGASSIDATLLAVTDGQDNGFIVVPFLIVGNNDAPAIGGDLTISVVQGGAVQLNANVTPDIFAVDDNPANELIYTVDATANGYVVVASDLDGALNGSAAVSFSQADLDAGQVFFVHGGANMELAGLFTVTVSDGIPGTVPLTATVTAFPSSARINVLTEDGYNFDTEDPIEKLGLGVDQMGLPAIVAGGTAEQFTVIYDAPGGDPAADRIFLFDGTFTYPGGVPSGFITKITEFDGLGVPRVEFLFGRDLVAAEDWLPAVVANAQGDDRPFELLVEGWSFSVFGRGGGDAFGSGDRSDSFTGNAGDDFFDGGFHFDRANYTTATGPITVDLASGTVVGIGVDTSSVGTDTLRSIEFIGGTQFDDIYIATGFDLQSANAGSTVGSNTAGKFNQFEGMGGDDTIVGNDETRVSYVHAFGGVTVDLDVGLADGSNPSIPAGTVIGQGFGTAPGDVARVGTDTFSKVNRIAGSYYDDILIGSDRTDVTEFLEGRGGDDDITGNGGFDIAVYNNDPDDGFGNGVTVDLAAGTVTGGFYTGNDTLHGVEGIAGTEFADTYSAAGFSSASANAGSIFGTNTNGTLNQFEGRGGDDIVTGNFSTRVVYSNATSGVTATLDTNGSGTAFGTAQANLLLGPGIDPAGIGTDIFLSGVSRLRGSEFNDNFTGNELANTLEGQGGNDVLSGLGGNDTLTGGAGSDRFVYSVGGADVITDFGKSQGAFSHDEGDRIDLRPMGVTNFTNLQSLLTESSGNSIITFSPGNTLTIQGVANAQLQGRDFVFSGQVAVTVQTPDGYNFGTLYDDMAGVDQALTRQNSARYVLTNENAGLIFSLAATTGTTFSYDAGGSPTGGTVAAIGIYDLDYNQLVGLVGTNIPLVNLLAAVNTYATTQDPSGLDAIFFNNAGVRYSAIGNFEGFNGFDQNSVNFGGDTFISGVGNDFFNGLTNANGDFNGGDTVDYSHTPGPTGVTVSLAISGQQNTIGSGTDALFNIENLRGSSFNDTLTGADFVSNVLEGGPGDDALDGGGGWDTASYEHAAAGVTVSLATAGPQDTGGAGIDTLINFGKLRGSAFDDTLTGNGTSTLEGGPGADDLVGQPSGSDVASYEHAAAGVTADLENPGPNNTGEAAGDTYTDIANLFGSRFNDHLIGDSGDNILDGGFGGNDTLTGGAGVDTFMFHGNNLTITDFSVLEDEKIDIWNISEIELQALIDAASGDTLNFGDGQSLTLTNVDVAQLVVASNFILHP